MRDNVLLRMIFSFFAFSLVAVCTMNAQTIGLKITSSGDAGIGTATPLEKLDVNGAVKLGTTSTANAGTLRFNGNCFEGYDGTSWVALGGSGCNGGGPSCTDGLQNQGETGVDCGGPCSPCSTGMSCENFPDIVSNRDLPNIGWNNQYNQGGTGITGDGEMCFTIDFIDGNTLQMIGVNSDPNTNASSNSIDNAILFYVVESTNRYWYRIYEDGAPVAPYVKLTSSFVGSQFCIERIGNTITYKKDGSVFYTSTSSSSGPLFFDNSFYDSPNNSVWGVRPSTFGITNIQFCDGPVSAQAPGPNTSQSIDGSTLIYHQHEVFMELESLEGNFVSQNFPNPFSGNTAIQYSIIDEAHEAYIEFYDMYGRKLDQRNLDLDSKGYINLDGTKLDQGTYIYNVVVDGEIIDSKKMVVIN